MTCILGIVDRKNKCVVIAGDSAASSGDSIYARKDSKVFKKDDFVIGCTSSYRMIQLLRYSLVIPPINGKDIYEYMCTDFISSVRECFKNGGYLQKFSDGDDKGGTFLVGYKDRLFKVDNDFQVGENSIEIDACGSGQDFAIASALSLNSDIQEKEYVVLKALSVTEELCSSVRSPFTLIKT